MLNSQVRLNSYPRDVVRADNFMLATDVPIRPLEAGEVLLQVRYISVDPAMRIYMDPNSFIASNPDLAHTFVRKGDIVRAWVVGEVVESRSAAFPVGSFARDIGGGGGVQAYSIQNEAALAPADSELAPLEAYLGILGMVGLTAYAGLVEVGEPRPGDTLLVSGAAGGVGGIVGQIGKAMGCRVIGIAGGPEKCGHVTGFLGFDACIDHRAGSLDDALAQVCPDGIDIYFDNVGGKMLDACLAHIRTRARIVACGAISAYQGDVAPLRNHMHVLMRQARWEAFSSYEVYADPLRFARAEAQLAAWYGDGTLRAEHRVFDGLENFVPALQAIYAGTTRGKVMLRLPH
ncbi:NADP-dependent oxidoreductase [Sphingobium sp. Sx8-8]|uniref:MDR family NADP-dependent oxidoreductase n=1 Tax=Sphingobium sp. Sx8-8 TaxID=2933617 RepID=UPI001F5ADAE5|nr:NADP-dependent oxidoreductase [Sphingobium sp. Sx8-8]